MKKANITRKRKVRYMIQFAYIQDLKKWYAYEHSSVKAFLVPRLKTLQGTAKEWDERVRYRLIKVVEVKTIQVLKT